MSAYSGIASTQHNVAQLPGANALAALPAAYIAVLAKDTAQVAAGEKYCARAALTADAGLLPKVGRGSCNARQSGAFAQPCGRVIRAFCAAGARTVITNVFHGGFPSLKCQ